MTLWASRARAAGVIFHVLHCGSINHWVLVAFRESKPRVVFYYDSCRGNPNMHIQSAIKQLLGNKVQHTSDGKITVLIAPSQRQTLGSNLCLFYSVANADYFIDHPSSFTPYFEENRMRPHLEKCLSSKTATPFPSRSGRAPENLPKTIYI